MRSWKCPSPRQRATDGTQQTALFPFEVNNHPTLCRPLSRAKDYAAINLGFRCAPPQALCYRLLRRLGLFQRTLETPQVCFITSYYDIACYTPLRNSDLHQLT